MVTGMAKKPDLLPGTLDMLILKTLTRAPLHGYGIALSIKHLSDDVLTVEEGSLYPALQRVLLKGWVKAEWKMTETNRRARFYKLTAAGAKAVGLQGVAVRADDCCNWARVEGCAGGLDESESVHPVREEILNSLQPRAVR
jgi:transcriptional regulator